MTVFQKLLLERCVRAFVAAVTAAISTQLAGTDLSLTGLRVVAIGAIAAGVSAVMSILSGLVGDPESTSFTKVEVGP